MSVDRELEKLKKLQPPFQLQAPPEHHSSAQYHLTHAEVAFVNAASENWATLLSELEQAERERDAAEKERNAVLTSKGFQSNMRSLMKLCENARKEQSEAEAALRTLRQASALAEKVVSAAVLFCETEQAQADFDLLEGCDSMSIPAEYILLGRAVKEFKSRAALAAEGGK